MSELLKGQVKWFNDAKGFGFIEHETGKDVFVHYSVIEGEGFKTLKDGEEVEYSLKEGEKGLNASRVIRVNQEVKPASMASMIEVEKVAEKKKDDEQASTPPAEQIDAVNSLNTSE